MSDEALLKPAAVNPIDDPAFFIEELQRCLSPYLQECFSKETKKLRNALLALTLGLLLLSLGALKFTGQGDLAGLKFDIERGASIKTAVALVVAFFVVIYCVRCYVEWASWRLKNLSPEWRLLALNNQLAIAQIEQMKERNELTEQVIGLQTAALNNAYTSVKASQAAHSEMTSKVAELERFTDSERQRKINGMSSLILKYVPKVGRARLFRFWLEAVFPALFGAYAVLGTFVPLVLLKF